MPGLVDRSRAQPAQRSLGVTASEAQKEAARACWDLIETRFFLSERVPCNLSGSGSIVSYWVYHRIQRDAEQLNELPPVAGGGASAGDPSSAAATEFVRQWCVGGHQGAMPPNDQALPAQRASGFRKQPKQQAPASEPRTSTRAPSCDVCNGLADRSDVFVQVPEEEAAAASADEQMGLVPHFEGSVSSMAQDVVRNDLFRRFIAAYLAAGSNARVIEIGAGTGVLSGLIAQLAQGSCARLLFCEANEECMKTLRSRVLQDASIHRSSQRRPTVSFMNAFVGEGTMSDANQKILEEVLCTKSAAGGGCERVLVVMEIMGSIASAEGQMRAIDFIQDTCRRLNQPQVTFAPQFFYTAGRLGFLHFKNLPRRRQRDAYIASDMVMLKGPNLRRICETQPVEAAGKLLQREEDEHHQGASAGRPVKGAEQQVVVLEAVHTGQAVRDQMVQQRTTDCDVTEPSVFNTFGTWMGAGSQHHGAPGSSTRGKYDFSRGSAVLQKLRGEGPVDTFSSHSEDPRCAANWLNTCTC